MGSHIGHFASCLWQDQFETVSDADLQSLDAKIVTLTAKVQSLQQSCRQMEAGRNGLFGGCPSLASGSVQRSGLLRKWVVDCIVVSVQ